MKLKAILFGSLFFALAGCSGADSGKGEESADPDMGSADSFFSPTVHGDMDFFQENAATFDGESFYHAWDFTLTGLTEVSLRVVPPNDAFDTVMYLYRRDPGTSSWGRYLKKNDDYEENLWSRIDSELDEGEYRLVVKGYKKKLRGSFTVKAICTGPGCPGGGDEAMAETLFVDAASGVLNCYFYSERFPTEVDEAGECTGWNAPNIWEDKTDRTFQVDIEDIHSEGGGSSFYHQVSGKITFRQDAVIDWNDTPNTEECRFWMNASFTDEDASLTVTEGPDCQTIEPHESECSARLLERLSPHLEGILYMSESDYPWTVFAYENEGEGEIDPQFLLETVMWKTTTDLMETRDFEEWIGRYADEDWGYEEDAPKYQAIREIMREELTDLRVIRIDDVQVKVFLIGRTECGEIAGIRTVSIET